MLKATDERKNATVRGPSMFPLRVEDLCFTIGGRTLVEHASFCLESTRATVVMGPNGAGKSLLLRMLHGLIVPTSGRISWGGNSQDDHMRTRQAMVFQRPTMLRRSARDNLAFVLGRLSSLERDQRIEQLITEAKLGHAASTPARLLSGGEQQRLAIARARANDPEILFLDEPSASLDPASTHAIEEQIRTIRADGTKIIMVTHDLGQARRLADEIIFISRGRIAEIGPADAFFNQPASDAARAYLEGRLDI